MSNDEGKIICIKADERTRKMKFFWIFLKYNGVKPANSYSAQIQVQSEVIPLKWYQNVYNANHFMHIQQYDIKGIMDIVRSFYLEL